MSRAFFESFVPPDHACLHEVQPVPILEITSEKIQKIISDIKKKLFDFQ